MISGTCDPAFGLVRSTFTSNFSDLDQPEVGASLCIIVDGRVRVDLWGGMATDTTPWHADTLVNSFSVGKGILSLMTAALVSRGVLSYDDLVTRWWPEFGCHGKETLRISDLLGHRTGLPAIRRAMTNDDMYDWTVFTDALALEEPWWAPGTAHGYHVNTFGFLVGEVLRRATGQPVNALLTDLFTRRLDADAYFGIVPQRGHSIADLRWHIGPSTVSDDTPLMQRHAYTNPPGLSGMGEVNSARWREAVLPSTNLHASARGIARIFADLVPLVSEPEPTIHTDVIARATTEVSAGIDRVLGAETRFGMGFQLPQPGRGFGPSPRAFGHYGAGGACGFVDPDNGVAFGYTMNQMGRGWQNSRNQGLINTLYECL